MNTDQREIENEAIDDCRQALQVNKGEQVKKIVKIMKKVFDSVLMKAGMESYQEIMQRQAELIVENFPALGYIKKEGMKDEIKYMRQAMRVGEEIFAHYRANDKTPLDYKKEVEAMYVLISASQELIELKEQMDKLRGSGIVPKLKMSSGMSDYQEGFTDGHNVCCQETLLRLTANLEKVLEKTIEGVLQDRIKVFGENEQTYVGYPAKLIKDLSLAIIKAICEEGSNGQ